MAIATKACAQCGTNFHLNTSPANIARQRFCSRACAAKSLTEIESFEIKMPRVLAERSAPQENGCILYTGQNNGHYGQVEYRRRTYLVHRVSFMLNKGAIGAGQMVCHSCDTPLCINPDHLWIGTGSNNVQDMISKGRQRYNPTKKLSDDDLAALRIEIGSVRQQCLAEKYGVSRSYISMLKNGVRRVE